MAFGSILGCFGSLLDTLERLWAFFFGIQNRTFIKRSSKMGSKRRFGWILGRFGKGLGRIWEGLGRILANFWMDFGHTNFQYIFAIAQIIFNTFLQFCVFFRTFDS